MVSSLRMSQEGKQNSMLYLAGLPLWQAILLVVILPTIIAVCGQLLVRKSVGLERLTTNNEIAGFKFATVGVIFAVIVAFAVIVVWEKFAEAESAVAQEGGAAATLYRLVAAPDPKMKATREALTNYLKLAIEKEWPAMAAGKASRSVTDALSALYDSVTRLAEGDTKQTALLIEMFKQLDEITHARRTRVHLASGVVPTVVWFVVFTAATLTVTFAFFFGAQNLRAQILMTAFLSLLTFTSVFAIVEINYPFTGPSNVGSHPLSVVLEDFSHKE
jgi:Protein of unknown function (DUF4239)